ncbi:MAG: DUF1559 domain-containing protein [Planctomycetota bacterium]
MQSVSSRRSGFSLIELLVVISIIALLIGLLLPSLASARETARSIQCSSRMRQLAMAADIYATDHDGQYPTRNVSPRWPAQFQPTYQAEEILLCPNDPNPTSNDTVPEEFDRAPRSFMFNGFNDLRNRVDNSDPSNPTTDFVDNSDQSTMDRDFLRDFSNTIFFGEKESGHDGYYVDIFADINDILIWIEQSRHGGTGNPERGGVSNYAFGDTSVRQFKANETVVPENLWAVRPAVRRP